MDYASGDASPTEHADTKIKIQNLLVEPQSRARGPS